MKHHSILLSGSGGLILLLSAVFFLPLTVLAAGGSVTHTTYADFSQSCGVLSGTIPVPIFTNTHISDLNGGTAILAATFTDDFNGLELDTGRWQTNAWPEPPGGAYTPTVSSSILTLQPGGRVRSVDTFGNRSLEFVAEFGAGQAQHVGFVEDDNFSKRLMFSTNNSSDTLFVRAFDGATNVDVGVGDLPTGLHRYRIEWDASNQVRFYLDSTVVYTYSGTTMPGMHVYMSNNGAADLQVDYLQVDPPYTSDGIYTSCALDAGVNNGWETITWDEVLPPSTTLAVEARVSNDGSTWSSWQSVSNGGLINSSLMQRYAQYRLLLAASDIQVTPLVNSVTLDFDTVPSLSLNDLSISENDPGGVAAFTVTLSTSSSYTVTVDYATANNTAITPDDYLASSGTLIFQPGVITQSITVPIQDDLMDEVNETFNLNLSNPSNVRIVDGQSLITIDDNDSKPTLNITNAITVTEGNSGTTNAIFNVSLSQASGKTITTTYQTANGSANAGDYTGVSGTLTFAPGVAAQLITVPVNGDTIVEPNETFEVNLTSVNNNATLGNSQGIGTITNDDTAGVTVTQSGGNTNVVEGGASDTYQVQLTSQPVATVTVNIAPNTQVSAAPLSLSFNALTWNTPQMVTVTATNDSVAEGAHTGIISHTAVSADAAYNSISISQVTANITDNDTAGVSVVPQNILIAEGGVTATYVINLTSSPASSVTVIVNPGVQVNANPASLNFTSLTWSTPQTVTVTAIDDAISEGSTHSSVITHTATSADLNYNNISIGNVSVSIADNETPAYELFLPILLK